MAIMLNTKVQKMKMNGPAGRRLKNSLLGNEQPTITFAVLETKEQAFAAFINELDQNVVLK